VSPNLDDIWNKDALAAANTRKDKEMFVEKVRAATTDASWRDRVGKRSRKATLAYASRIEKTDDAVYIIRNSAPPQIIDDMTKLVEWVTPGTFKMCTGKPLDVPTFDSIWNVIAANLTKALRLSDEGGALDMGDFRIVAAWAQVITLASLTGLAPERVTHASAVCGVLYAGWLDSPERTALL